MGGHGERLHQCKEVTLTTYKSIPMQVDGEPCKLAPSIIHINLRNQANMVQKAKRRISMPHLNEYIRTLHTLEFNRVSLKNASTDPHNPSPPETKCVCERHVRVCVCSQQPVPEKLQIRVNRISMAAYEALHYDKDQLKEACESPEG